MSPHPPRFLIEGPAESGANLELDPDEAKHARVKRLRTGEVVALFDGAGNSWLASVECVGRERVTVRVTQPLERDQAESPLDLTLAVAVLKADRFDWLVEKATELGVTAIQPIASRHSLAEPSARRQERWQQIALGAVKQCGRSTLPCIERPRELRDLLAGAACRLLLDEGGGEMSFAQLRERPNPGKVTVIVGPEGGFAGDEIEAARAASCLLLGLGKRILRSETAAITAVALCQHLWGDLG